MGSPIRMIALRAIHAGRARMECLLVPALAMFRGLALVSLERAQPQHIGKASSRFGR
jgi:hypothetical protein